MVDNNLNPEMLWQIVEGEKRCRVFFRAMPIGKDLMVQVEGGTSPHIGAVALAVPRPSLKAAGSLSSTASVLTLTGHKDDELARMISLYLAKELSCVVTVVAGVHINSATEDEIVKIIDNAKRAARRLAEAAKDNNKIALLIA